MKVYLAGGVEPLGSCGIVPPPGSYHVVRAVDASGEYHRIKATVRREGGEVGLEVSSLEHAGLLPGFHPAVGMDPPALGPGGGTPVSGERTPSGRPHGGHDLSLLRPEGDPRTADLESQVRVRLLDKLGQAVWKLSAAVPLLPGETLDLVLPLPPLPLGNLFFKPEPALPLAMTRILGKVGLGQSSPSGMAVLRLKNDAALELPVGMTLGVVESRSFSEPPDGMRDKVFQSHVLSKLEEALREREGKGWSLCSGDSCP
ncbi:MAG: hypothetical protein HQL51_09440 [Magnetococcales bacterium]|nr:hypothetical protein [Magnetococcales bacterium]